MQITVFTMKTHMQIYFNHNKTMSSMLTCHVQQQKNRETVFLANDFFFFFNYTTEKIKQACMYLLSVHLGIQLLPSSHGKRCVNG